MMMMAVKQDHNDDNDDNDDDERFILYSHSLICGSSTTAVVISPSVPGIPSSGPVGLFWMRMIQEILPLGRLILISAHPWQMQ